MTSTIEPAATGADGYELLKTDGGHRLHIAPCPHLRQHGNQVPRPVTAAERTSFDLCAWCEKEVSGHGRTYVASLEEAMRRFGSHVGTTSLIRDHLRDVEWDQIWIPYSNSYIALGLEGRAIAWVGKGYVVPRRGEFVPLPGFVGHGSGGGTPSEEMWGSPCVRCFMQKSVSGECDCD